MDRIAIEGGGWFYPESATEYKPKPPEERLFRTRGGAWILRSSYSNEYTRISREDAAEWFARNEYGDSMLPEDVREIVYSLEV